MQPVRQIGPTATVAGGATAAIANSTLVVLVANASTTTTGYFTAQDTSAVPTSALGMPIPPLQSIPVAIPHNAKFYGAFGTALAVTPVEMLKSQ